MSRTSSPQRRLYFSGLFLVIVLIIGCAGYRLLGIYYDEDWTLLDAIYMTVITLSTVGYDEILPLKGHDLARIFTMILLLMGMGTILLFLSNFTAFIVEGDLSDLIRRRRMEKQLDKLKNHIFLCGIGETGWHIAVELFQTKTPTVIIDYSEERCDRFVNEIGEIPYICGDATEDDILYKAGLERAAGLITALTADRDNLFVTITARQLSNRQNAKLRIVSRVVNLAAEAKLRKAGADEVVSPNQIGGMHMVSSMIRPTVVTFMDKMMHMHDRVLRIEEVELKDTSSVIGKTLAECAIRKRHDLSVIAINDTNSGEYLYNPDPQITLRQGMVLICLGEVESIHGLRDSL